MELIATLVLLTVLFNFSRAFVVASEYEKQKEDHTCAGGQYYADADNDLDYKYSTTKDYFDIDFGEKQEVGGKKWRETLDNLEVTKKYMEMVRTNRTLQSVRNDCKCRNQLCSFWAAIGMTGRTVTSVMDKRLEFSRHTLLVIYCRQESVKPTPTL